MAHRQPTKITAARPWILRPAQRLTGCISSLGMLHARTGHGASTLGGFSREQRPSLLSRAALALLLSLLSVSSASAREELGHGEPRYRPLPRNLHRAPYALTGDTAGGKGARIQRLSPAQFTTLTGGAKFIRFVTTDPSARRDVEADSYASQSAWGARLREIAGWKPKERGLARGKLAQRIAAELPKPPRAGTTEAYVEAVRKVFESLSVEERYLLFGEAVEKGLSADLYVMNQGKGGLGVAVQRGKQPGQFLAVFTGRQRPFTLDQKVDSSYGIGSPIRVPKRGTTAKGEEALDGPDLPGWVDGKQERNLAALINDSAHGHNVFELSVMTPKGWVWVLVAGRPLAAREPLSLDYGPYYWKDGKHGQRGDLSREPLSPLKLP